jgi:hypothetical protein
VLTDGLGVLGGSMFNMGSGQTALQTITIPSTITKMGIDTIINSILKNYTLHDSYNYDNLILKLY